MKRRQTVLSPRADRAVDRAKLLQKQMDADLCVIHATKLAIDEPPDLVELNRAMRAATGLNGSEERVSFLFRSGIPPNAIVGACKECRANLLVLGPARYNILGDHFLGTAVDYVLRRTTKPVLVVKNRAHDLYRQIVAGTDFSPGSAHAIITAARMFPDAKVHIVHAWHVPFEAWNKDAYVAKDIERENRDKMEKFVAELVSHESSLSDATNELVRGGANDALRAGLDRNPSALVVLGSHGSSGLAKVPGGSASAVIAVAVNGPIPGIVISRRAVPSPWHPPHRSSGASRRALLRRCDQPDDVAQLRQLAGPLVRAAACLQHPPPLGRHPATARRFLKANMQLSARGR